MQIPVTITNCGLIRMRGGVKEVVHEHMEEDGCRGRVRRGIVEDRSSKGEGAGMEREKS